MTSGERPTNPASSGSLGVLVFREINDALFRKIILSILLASGLLLAV
ncbi:MULTISPECIES: hypothetical protein [unclassified Bradyrhizobium]|nr:MULTISPECIES: hypothetical protein [unclassified Bradyrhizobium]